MQNFEKYSPWLFNWRLMLKFYLVREYEYFIILLSCVFSLCLICYLLSIMFYINCHVSYFYDWKSATKTLFRLLCRIVFCTLYIAFCILCSVCFCERSIAQYLFFCNSLYHYKKCSIFSAVSCFIPRIKLINLMLRSIGIVLRILGEEVI